MFDARWWESLGGRLLGQFRLPRESAHGPGHWSRVERFGLQLATRSGADPLVVRLFAYFHDAARVAEGGDPGHGTRGAALVARFQREGLLRLDRRRLLLLIEACDAHSEVLHHPDPTIGTCFDADRLDLARYGMRVDARFLNTVAAKRWVSSGINPAVT